MKAHLVDLAHYLHQNRFQEQFVNLNITSESSDADSARLKADNESTSISSRNPNVEVLLHRIAQLEKENKMISESLIVCLFVKEGLTSAMCFHL
jgi:hypothetical protein